MKDSHLNIDLFEQVFDEKSLKKGLLLFQKSKIRLLEKRSGGEFVFGFEGQQEITLQLKKRANKINNYNCSCKNIKCEHLCTAMFFLSDEKIQLKKVKRLNKGIKKDNETLFNAICHKIKVLKKKFPNQMGESAINVIRFLEERMGVDDKLGLNLAIVNEFSENLFFTKTFNSIVHNNVLHAAIANCNKILKRELNVFQKEILLICTRRVISNNRKFNSGVFFYLLPHALKHFKTPNQFKEFKILIGKRKLRHNYQQYLNIQKIAHYQLTLAEAEVLNVHHERDEIINAELSVAKAELSFADKKSERAFKNLIVDYQKIQKSIPHNYIAYLDYIIDKANELKNPQIELDFLKINILYDPVISEAKLSRLKELMKDNTERNEFFQLALNKFKRQPELYFEKLTMLLESEKRYDELIAEINKQNNKFFLMNRIAIKKLPQYDDFTFKVYIKQFDNILYEAREQFHQTEIFERLKLYLEKLPTPVSIKLVTALLAKVSRNNFIHSELEKYSEKLTGHESTPLKDK